VRELCLAERDRGLLEPERDPLPQIARRRQRLLGSQLAPLEVEDDEVRERPTDVDADSVTRQLEPPWGEPGPSRG
jgi:hypothetical protein